MAIGLLIVLGVAVVGMLIVFAIIAATIRHFMNRAGNAAAQIGYGLANQASSSLMRVGTTELVKGWDTFKQTVSHEMLTSDPQKMATAVTKLAQRHQGELTTANVMTELSVSEDLAEKTLDGLVREQVCERRGDLGGSGVRYVFPAFQQRREVRICDYCASVFELGELENQTGCLNCGATDLRAATTT